MHAVSGLVGLSVLFHTEAAHVELLGHLHQLAANQG
jgi:hypothetical protein